MPSVPAAMWYVMLGETETGPLTRVDVGVEAASGKINGETLVWREGMSDWQPGAKVPELAQLFLNPPKSPRLPGARPPPPPAAKKSDKGTGISDFDTAHFRLAELATRKALEGDSGASRQMEFDTSHFRLQELGEAKGGDRLAVPKRINPSQPQAAIELDKPAKPPPLELDLPAEKKRPLPKALEPKPPRRQPVVISGKPRSTIKQASTAAENPAAPAAAVKSVRSGPVPRAPPPAAKPATPATQEPFDPNRTSVDFRTLGALVHQQQVVQSQFESEIVPDAKEVEPDAPKLDPKTEALLKAEQEKLEKERAARLQAKQDLAALLKAKALAKAEAPKGPSIWLYVGIGGGILAAIAAVLFLVLD